MDSPLIPGDFGPRLPLSTDLDNMRVKAEEASARVQAEITLMALPKSPVRAGWVNEDLVLLSAISDICGNRWRLLGDFIPSRNIQAIKAAVLSARKNRDRRCPSSNYPNPSSFILEDYRHHRPWNRAKAKVALNDANSKLNGGSYSKSSLGEVRKRAIEALIQANDVIANQPVSPTLFRPDWSNEDLVRLIAISDICGSEWALMSELIPTHTKANITSTLGSARELQIARCTAAGIGFSSPLQLVDFTLVRPHPLCDDKRVRALDALAALEEDLRNRRLPDIEVPSNWQCDTILKIICIADICVGVPGLMFELVGRSANLSRDMFAHHIKKAEEKRRARCKDQRLCKDTPLIPRDFSPRLGLLPDIYMARKKAEEALVRVQAEITASDLPKDPVRGGWLNEDLIRLAAISDICGNRWKLLGELIPSNSWETIMTAVLCARKNRDQRCPAPDVGAPSPAFILEDFSFRRGRSWTRNHSTGAV